MKHQLDRLGEDEPRTPEALVQRAQFRKCLESLEGDTSPKALYLRMRAMLYLGRHHEVVRADFLSAVQAIPAIERARVMALVATAFFRCDMRTASENAFREAYSLAGNEPDVLAEIHFYEALLRWSANDLERAETLVNQIIGDQRWRAKALDVRSWIRAKRGDYRGQLRDLLDAYASIREEDVWEKASILRASSALARELYDPMTAGQIATWAENLPWTEETNEHEYYTFRYLAWCAALGGQSLAAYDYLARARDVMPSAPHAVLLNADRAIIARFAGERETSGRFLERAREAAFTADWRQNGESRTALLVLAEIIAPTDPKTAWQYIEEYTKIRSGISPLLSFGAGDVRLEALEQYAAGVVYRFNGKRDLAIKSLKRALTIWKEIGYKWRAALAAFHLGEIDRPHYIDLSKKIIDETVPNAFFSGILAPYRNRLEHPDVVALSRSRRDVLALFMQGLTNQQIAERLGVQVQSVKNNLRYVFRYFDAHSARDLWPILRSRGII